VSVSHEVSEVFFQRSRIAIYMHLDSLLLEHLQRIYRFTCLGCLYNYDAIRVGAGPLQTALRLSVRHTPLRALFQEIYNIRQKIGTKIARDM